MRAAEEYFKLLQQTGLVIGKGEVLALMKAYAKDAIEEQLKIAAEAAKTYSKVIVDPDYYGERNMIITEVDKNSILDCTRIDLK